MATMKLEYSDDYSEIHIIPDSYSGLWPEVEIPEDAKGWILRVEEEWAEVQEYLRIRLDQYYEERRNR